MVFEKLVELLSEQFGVEPETITLQTSFDEDLGADSLDLVELMMAGATAVEVGAANLVNPFACKEIVEQLPQVMEQYHIETLTEIIGGAHHG